MEDISDNEFTLKNQLTMIGSTQEISKLFSLDSDASDAFRDEVEKILDCWNKKISEYKELENKLLN